MGRKTGHILTVVDALGEALDDYHEFIRNPFVNGLSIEEDVRRIDPVVQVIGVSVMFSKNWSLVQRLMATLRDTFPSAVIVIGSEHVTAAPEHVLETAPVNYAVLGEGNAHVRYAGLSVQLPILLKPSDVDNKLLHTQPQGSC